MSQRDKTRTVEGEFGRMGQTLARMALSMNQGNFGTCTSYAFTTALCQSLLGKYGVALKMETLCQIFISRHKLWNGASPLDLANKWNERMTDESFLDLDSQKKYKLRLKNIRRIGTLDEAHTEMLKRQDALKMIVTVKTDTTGHTYHAVSADVAHASPSKDIRAINSWGANRPTWEVTAKNFIDAVVFDPIITKVMKGTTNETVPDVTKAYKDMGKRYSMEIGKLPPKISALPRVNAGYVFFQNVGSKTCTVKTCTVHFKKEWKDVPNIVVMISSLDCKTTSNVRIAVTITTKSKRSFTIQASCWADSYTYGLEVMWIAAESNSRLVQVGSIREVGSYPNNPTTKDKPHGGKISFPNGSFSRNVPGLIIGYSLLDIDTFRKLPIRFGVEATNISKMDFKYKFSTWNDSKTWQVNLSYVAVDAAIGECIRNTDVEKKCPSEWLTKETRKFKTQGEAFVGSALRKLDALSGPNLRFKCSCNKTKGCNVAIETLETWCADTRVWTAGTTCLALRTSDNDHALQNEDIPGYKIETPSLGSGFWGHTYKAKSLLDGRMCAIKKIKNSFKSEEAWLRKELENLGKVPCHPNLVRYYHSMVLRDTLYISMELIPGDTMEHLRPTGSAKWPTNVLLEWTRQLFDGLASMHEVGMIHRDIHPGNLMIVRDDKSGETLRCFGGRKYSVRRGAVKIIDVGNATFKQPFKIKTRTQIGGTRRYWTHGRCEDKGYNHKDDIWACACVMAEICIGTPLSSLGQYFGSNAQEFSFPKNDKNRMCHVLTKCKFGRNSRIGRLLEACLLTSDPSKIPDAASVVKRASKFLDEGKAKP